MSIKCTSHFSCHSTFPRLLINHRLLPHRPRLSTRSQSDHAYTALVETGLVFQRSFSSSWDSSLLGNPVVCCFVGDNEQRWYMYYTGTSQQNVESHFLLSGNTGVATSSDGFQWTRPGIERETDDGLNIVLKENKENWWSFDTSSISVSDVQIMFSPKVNAGEEGVFWMYYSGCSSEPSIKTEERELVIRSGLAMSQNGYHWARIEGSDSSGAVLDVGEEKDWDCAFIGRPQVLNCGNRDLRMYYHSYDIHEECYKIGLAKSGNGLNWEKSGVIFKGSEMYQFDSKGAASQCVVYDQDNAQFLMFYEAVNDSNGRSIGLAVSKDGLENWKAYKEPVLSPSVSGRWDSGAVGTPWAVSMEEGKWRIYYSGTKQTAPYWEGIGVATSDQSGTKFHKVPVQFNRKKLQ